MTARAHNRPALVAMILAALACYANAPRLAATLMLGDAANFAAVRDAATRARLRLALAQLPEHSPQADQLAQRLDEGERSRAVADSLPPLPEFVAPSAPVPTLEPPAHKPPTVAKAVTADHWALRDGAILTTCLPPPPDPGPAARPRTAPRAEVPQARPRAPPVTA